MIDSSIIQKYSLFNGLEPDQINSILPLMVEESYKSGTDIITEGNHNDKIHFILEGRVAVKKGIFILAELEEGSTFGEMEVLDVMPVEATITALKNTKVLTLSIDALGEIYVSDLKIYSFILMNLARDISRRLRRMNEKAADKTPLMEWN